MGHPLAASNHLSCDAQQSLQKFINVAVQTFHAELNVKVKRDNGLLMDRLTKGLLGGINLFEGMEGHLLPCRNYDMLSGGLFLLLGKMVFHLVITGCCGLSGLSSAAIGYI